MQSKNRYMAYISGTQCRMARAALQMSVRDLAEKAGVSTNTISRLEGGEALKPATVEPIGAVLVAAGVEFIPATDDGGEGVRLTASEG